MLHMIEIPKVEISRCQPSLFRVQTRQIGVGQYFLQSQDRADDAIEKLSHELVSWPLAHAGQPMIWSSHSKSNAHPLSTESTDEPL